MRVWILLAALGAPFRCWAGPDGDQQARMEVLLPDKSTRVVALGVRGLGGEGSRGQGVALVALDAKAKNKAQRRRVWWRVPEDYGASQTIRELEVVPGRGVWVRTGSPVDGTWHVFSFAGRHLVGGKFGNWSYSTPEPVFESITAVEMQTSDQRAHREMYPYDFEQNRLIGLLGGSRAPLVVAWEARSDEQIKPVAPKDFSSMPKLESYIDTSQISWNRHTVTAQSTLIATDLRGREQKIPIDGFVSRVAVSKDNKRIALATLEGEVMLFEVIGSTQPELKRIFAAPLDPTQKAKVPHVQSYLSFATRADLRVGKEGDPDPYAGSTGLVGPQPVSMPVAVAFSPDGTRIAVATLEIQKPRAAVVNLYATRDGQRLGWGVVKTDEDNNLNSREVENLRDEFHPTVHWRASGAVDLGIALEDQVRIDS